MKNDATKPSMAGFYIPPQVLDSNDFKKGRSVFHVGRWTFSEVLGTDGIRSVHHRRNGSGQCRYRYRPGGSTEYLAGRCIDVDDGILRDSPGRA